MLIRELLLDNATVYHGSATSGITEFERAEEDTIGAGVYLTDERAARGYALHRARYEGAPVLYEVHVEHARLVDLTDQDTVTEVMDSFRPVLQAEHFRAAHEGGPWFWLGTLERLLTEIDHVGVGNLKAVTRQSGELFTQHLQDQGFDGVFAMEGGEGEIGNHQTYPIFDPAKLQLRSEQTVGGNAGKVCAGLGTGVMEALRLAEVAEGAPAQESRIVGDAPRARTFAGGADTLDRSVRGW